VAYPTQLVAGVNVPYLYGLIPGWRFGPTIRAAAGPTDVITVANADTIFLLNCYNLQVLSNTVVQFNLAPLPPTCVVPAAQVQAINDPVVGLTPGDLVLFNLTIGVGAGATNATVLAEVTNVVRLGAGIYNVTFNVGDPLRMNQPAAAAGSLGTIPVNSTGSANRINVITYYLDNTITPPRLMRQISGHSPIPVAENVSFLQFDYDLYNFNTGSFLTTQSDGGASQGLTPNQITKINIRHMSFASTLHGASGYQGLDLQTSVSARDLTFKNDYPVANGP
jgi:hypothetical protein